MQISEIRTILGDTQITSDGQHHDLLSVPLNVLTAVIIGVIAFSEVVVAVTYYIWREFGLVPCWWSSCVMKEPYFSGDD
jgi:hypothetical protein